jgi:outer membrane protein OmpA-like peptidoglycan-associated protein
MKFSSFASAAFGFRVFLGLGLFFSHFSVAWGQGRPSVEVNPQALTGAQEKEGVIRAPQQLRLPGGYAVRQLPALHYPLVTAQPIRVSPPKKEGAKNNGAKTEDDFQRAASRPTAVPASAEMSAPPVETLPPAVHNIDPGAAIEQEIGSKPPKVGRSGPSSPPDPDAPVAAQSATGAVTTAKTGMVATAAPPRSTNQKAASDQTLPAPTARAPSQLGNAAIASSPAVSASPVAPLPAPAPKASSPTPSAVKEGDVAMILPEPEAVPERLDFATGAPAEPQLAARQTPGAQIPMSGMTGSVTFGAGSSELSGTVRTQLDALAARLANGESRILLEAYAGAAGDRSSEARRLALKRGLAVRDYLMAKGVSGARINVRALGGALQGNPERVDIRPTTG